MSQEVKKLIEDMPNIPSMPLIILNLLDQLNKPEPDIIKLSATISKDLSLTAQLLNLVNSAYFGFSSRINTVTQATVLLGLDRVRNLVISAAIKPMITTICGKNLWEHSIRCAVGAELIAKKLNDNRHEEAFTAGLLHDIGKIILELHNSNFVKEVHYIFSGTPRDPLSNRRTLSPQADCVQFLPDKVRSVSEALQDLPDYFLSGC